MRAGDRSWLTVTRRHVLVGVFGCGPALWAAMRWSESEPVDLFVYDGRYRAAAADSQQLARLGVPAIDCGRGAAAGSWLSLVSDVLRHGGCVRGSTLWIDSFAAETLVKDGALRFDCRIRPGSGVLRSWKATV